MKLFAQKDAEAYVKTGAGEFRYNRDTRITPGAKDVLSEAGIKVVFDADGAAGTTPAPAAGTRVGHQGNWDARRRRFL